MNLATAPERAGWKSSLTGRISAPIVLLGVLLLTLLISAVHLSQGSSSVGAGDLFRLLTGNGDELTSNAFIASRLPRLLAGLIAGLALGAAGALLQSISRNALASPDTLGVTAGAAFTVTLVAAFGIVLPVWLGGLVGFFGGLAAAAVVFLLIAGRNTSVTRLVLGGSAVAMALQAATALLLLLFAQRTIGLFAWGNGSLTQIDLRGVWQVGPIVLLALAAAVLYAHKFDLLALGDDAVTVLGVRPGRIRLLGILLAVLLTGASVALCGPLGFVGLSAPAIAKLLAAKLPGLAKHRFLIPLSALLGAVVVLGSDVLIRWIGGVSSGIEIPTGVSTTLLGAVFLIFLARRVKDAGAAGRPAAASVGRPASRRRFLVIFSSASLLLTGSVIIGMLSGFTWLLGGDVLNWLTGQAPPGVSFALDERFPRVLAAVLAGAALAAAGSVIQSVSRNPLAEPYTTGITAGAGVGVIGLLIAVPTAAAWQVSLVALLGAVLAFALVYGLSWKGGIDSARIMLIGVGASAGGGAITTFLLVKADPWNTPLALTWLSGTTYGRSLDQLIPVGIALLLLLPLLFLFRRDIDVLALDENTPRIVGIRLEPVRLLTLGVSVLLAATAVSAVGVVGFVGLVAPHIARSLVGAHSAKVLPLSAVIGAVLVSVADTLGRTVIAPAQVPAGLIVALIGTPYFVYLLYRTR
ncbi:iron ABC transporter permease [Arthrobacter russicus]|uniref:Iron complex transport system permease protein n=1 Tax=Arthrobacter russicus TaxID=172040 RepID=A0ABU1JHP8_9MICC|nr:iron ABC transporter permease [Arthrobacter russicus]MDR6270887.1 iron complex transport system permease protein [Arthrobacter russicus]